MKNLRSGFHKNLNKATHMQYLLRWQLTPLTRKMANPQGPKTESGNAADHETENVRSHLLASAIGLVNVIAPNLQKGN